MQLLKFPSGGEVCAAWYLPASTGALAGPYGRPCVVMAHGFGGTRDCGLLPYAEGFAAGCPIAVRSVRSVAWRAASR